MESFKQKEEAAARRRTSLPGRLSAWAKFGVGLLLLLALALVLSKGFTPPGAAGTVLRHNQNLGLDATPLFYTEVEGFADFERDLPSRAGDR